MTQLLAHISPHYSRIQKRNTNGGDGIRETFRVRKSAGLFMAKSVTESLEFCLQLCGSCWRCEKVELALCFYFYLTWKGKPVGSFQTWTCCCKHSVVVLFPPAAWFPAPRPGLSQGPGPPEAAVCPCLPLLPMVLAASRSHFPPFAQTAA